MRRMRSGAGKLSWDPPRATGQRPAPRGVASTPHGPTLGKGQALGLFACGTSMAWMSGCWGDPLGVRISPLEIGRSGPRQKASRGAVWSCDVGAFFLLGLYEGFLVFGRSETVLSWAA